MKQKKLFNYRPNRNFSAPKFYSQPQNRVCEEGERFRFRCIVSGQPMPLVTWFKDGKRLDSSSRVVIGEKNEVRFLEIEEALLNDAGIYRITLGKLIKYINYKLIFLVFLIN
jgi:hypothetical protein